MAIAKHVIFVLIEEKNKYGLIGLLLWFYDIYIKIYELSRGSLKKVTVQLRREISSRASPSDCPEMA